MEASQILVKSMDSSKDINKKVIRKYILEKRNLLSQKEWKEKSQLICSRVVTHPFFLNADEIYCYLDYKNEVGTREIIERAWALGKKVAAPKIIGDEMFFFYIDNFQDLEDGYCHIQEPNTNCPANGKNVLVIMPGAVFDKTRNRVGYGKGFYDRYLEKNPTFHTLALAFMLQLVENIPADIYDKKPEIIITEDKIYV